MYLLVAVEVLCSFGIFMIETHDIEVYKNGTAIHLCMILAKVSGNGQGLDGQNVLCHPLQIFCKINCYTAKNAILKLNPKEPSISSNKALPYYFRGIYTSEAGPLIPAMIRKSSAQSALSLNLPGTKFTLAY